MARHRSHNSKYIVMVMVIIVIGYVYMNPNVLGPQGTLPQLTQTYSGDIDTNTMYYDDLKQIDVYELDTDLDYIDDVKLYDDDYTRDEIRKLSGK